MPNETTLKNSIKIFSSKYLSDLSFDAATSYVLNFSFVTTFKSKLKNAFEQAAPLLLEEPLEAISGSFTLLPKGLKSVLSAICQTDAGDFTATTQSDFKHFHIVANCYDPAAVNNFIGYYCGFCRISQIPYSDLSDIALPIKVQFTGNTLKTALGAFDAFNAPGTNSVNQEVAFNNTPLLFEGNYAASVFVDDTLLTKGTDYSEDATKVTLLQAVPVTSKITVVYIYNPQA